jgi:hypothetical protein
MHRLRILIPAILLAGACSSSSGPAGPDSVDLIGSWSLRHSFVVLGTVLATCDGALSVVTQADGAFSGDVSIDAGSDCAGVAGNGTFSGTATRGVIAFTVSGLGLDDLLALADCLLVSATGFRGTASDTALIAVDTRTYSCLDPATQAQVPVQLQWQIAGEKVVG